MIQNIKHVKSGQVVSQQKKESTFVPTGCSVCGKQINNISIFGPEVHFDMNQLVSQSCVSLRPVVSDGGNGGGCSA